MPVKRKKLLGYSRSLGHAHTEGAKHLKIADGNGNTIMIPRGSKYKDLEDCYVKQFARVFGVDIDTVWNNVR